MEHIMSELNPADFDLDAWIKGLAPDETTVNLYPRNREFQARLAELQQKALDAERTRPENRGMDDPSPEQISLMISELKSEWQASAVPVRIRELRDREIAKVAKAAVENGATTDEANVHVLAAALVEPKISPDQLLKMRDANVEGEAFVAELSAALTRLRQGVTAPFSPGS